MTTKDTYFYAIGRRKGAVAQIKLFQSKGNITINKKPLEEVFQSKESIDSFDGKTSSIGFLFIVIFPLDWNNLICATAPFRRPIA